MKKLLALFVILYFSNLFLLAAVSPEGFTIEKTLKYGDYLTLRPWDDFRFHNPKSFTGTVMPYGNSLSYDINENDKENPVLSIETRTMSGDSHPYGPSTDYPYKLLSISLKAIGGGTCTLSIPLHYIWQYTSDGTQHTVLNKKSTIKYVIHVPSVVGITLPDTVKMKKGGTYTIIPSLERDGDAPYSLSWSSSDTNVATVSEDGTITALDYGTSMITCTASSGVSATCIVWVNQGPCGENLKWKYDCGVLTISGEGEMDINHSDSIPWHLYRNSIEKVIIENGVTTIGFWAFRFCTNLTSVIIPNSVTDIGSSAFYGCTSLTFITIPNSVSSIGHGAFSGCTGLTSITIPNSVTDIGANPFEGCEKLISIAVEPGNSRYDSRNNCNAIIETSTNTLITGCKTTIIPNSVTTIGDRAFAYCSDLLSINIPNGVTTIGVNAFDRCKNLTSVTIPNSMESIKTVAFWNCTALTDIYCYTEQPLKISKMIFLGLTLSNMTLHVPSVLIELYKNDTVWKEFKDIVALTDDDPMPTCINRSEIRTSNMGGYIYDINGKKLKQPVKGINIINGKKVLK